MIFQQPLTKILLVFLYLVILAPDGTVYAQKELLEEDGIAVIFDEGLRPGAEESVRLYPGIKSELEDTINWKINFTPGIVLIKDHDAFQRMSGNRLTVAYALPAKDIMVIDYSRIMINPFTLEAIIKHELCHLLLHKNIGEDNLPRWLDEGIAQWVSGGLADIVMEKNSVLYNAFRRNRIIRLKYLERGFPDDDNLLMLSYAESKDFVEYMIREKDIEGLLILLGHLKEGDTIDTAIAKTFSVPLDELEKRWHSSLGKKTVWIRLLINNLYEILFFLAAVIMVYGFIRAWIRKKRYREEEDG